MDHTTKPKRLAEASNTRRAIAQDLAERRELVVHNRPASGDISESTDGPVRKGYVLVEVWQEADGSESIVVCGDAEMKELEIKGLLHDGVYSIAHRGEAGFTA